MCKSNKEVMNLRESGGAWVEWRGMCGNGINTVLKHEILKNTKKVEKNPTDRRAARVL